MSENELELLKLKEELSILKKTQQSAMLSWWSVNFSTRTYHFSDYLRDMSEINQNEMSFEEFNTLIHPDHFDKVIRYYTQFSQIGIYEERFQIMTKFGYRWVHSKLGRKEINHNGELVALGYIRLLDESEVEMLEFYSSELGNKEHIEKNSIIFASLMELLYENGTDIAIEKTLNDILTILGANRVYIFEYDETRKFQSCTYEVCSQPIYSERANDQNVPTMATPWLSNELLNQVPIFANGLGELPEEAAIEREYLRRLGVNSAMIVPLVSHEQPIGFIGINIVNSSRIWSKQEKQLFISIAKIISLCMELKCAIKTAEAEQRRFNDLFEHMPMAFLKGKVIYNKERKPIDYLLLEANSSIEKITGIKRDLFIGKLGSVLEEARIVDKKIFFFDTILKSPSALSEVNIVTNSGLYYAYTAYAAGDDEFVVIFHDNTENIAAHRDLIKNRTKLDKIFQNVPIGIEIYNKDGILMEINDADVKIHGVVREEVIGKVNLFNNPNAPKQYLEELKNGNNVDIKLYFDYKVIADSNYYSTSLRKQKYLAIKSTILYDANGKIESYILVIADNTETITANDKIQEFELLFNSMSEIAAIGLSRYNITKDKFTVTDQWCTNMCKTQSDIDDFRKTYSNLSIEDMAFMGRKFKELRDGAINDFKYEVKIHNEGNEKWIKCFYKISQVKAETGEIELVGLNIDITTQKNIEKKLIEAKIKAEESDRLKSAFVANMSHEIRTPLNAIVGFSDMMTETDDPEERAQYISIIKQNNDLLLQLISDILDISRIESGISSCMPELVDIDSMCKELVRSYAIKAPKEVRLLFDQSDNPCQLLTDKNKLIQILTNLMGNAIKFTKQGEIRLGYKKNDEETLIYVKDTGIGIDEEQILTIFDRFVKLNTFMQGTGLGLPICRSLADKMGGTIWVESELGKGSCFWLSLPNQQQ